MSGYRVTLEVELADDLDGGTMQALTSILLTACDESSVPVAAISVEVTA